jgi:glycosyltransferase involved in cell wall biosynthesis
MLTSQSAGSATSAATSGIRVCVVLTRLGAGGPPFVVRELLLGLREQGIEATLIVGSCETGHDCEMDYLSDSNIPVVYIEAMSRSVNWLQDLKAFVALQQAFRSLRPHVVHTHTSKAGVIGRLAAVITRVPVVVHTFHGNVLKGYFGRLVSRAVQTLEKVLAFGTDVLFVLSHQQAREIAQEFGIAPERKVQVIPLGVDARRFAQIYPPAEGKHKLTVGWFGRFVPIKDIPLLINVIERTVAKSGNIDFVIGGDGPGRDLIESVVQRCGAGRVRYLGWVTDLREVLSEVDVVLQTSLNEGTPVAVLEGMASARPFVSTAVGGLVDMVSGVAQHRNDVSWYDNGVLTGRDPESIADALVELMRNRTLVATMGVAARRVVEERFVHKAYVDRTLAAYRRCLELERV